MMSLDLTYHDEFTHSCGQPLPGSILDAHLECASSEASNLGLRTILHRSCRKLALMSYAANRAVEAEEEFYVGTLKEAPALFGEDAVHVFYHLESMVLLGRAALDVAAPVFGEMLRDRLSSKKHFGSFNDLVKQIVKCGSPAQLASEFLAFQSDPHSWFSLLCGTERGRSLRDKIAHQTEFPLDYAELSPPSEKETAVVILDGEKLVPLRNFVHDFRTGVITGFRKVEQACVET